MQTAAHIPASGIFIATQPHWLAAAATQALVDEARLTPKPGLVDQRGSGAHHDLTLALLLRSAHTLQPYFERIAMAAQCSAIGIALREELGALGREAEAAMLEATRGINTHRGAIWNLGLLVAAAAHHGQCADEHTITHTAGRIASLPDRHMPIAGSNGLRAHRLYGADGARGEAISAFPHVVDVGLPALRRARACGMGEEHARLDALLSIMGTLADTCLLHRGGLDALYAAQKEAQSILMAGGSSTPQGQQLLAGLDRTLLRLWASPGGAADLLAATLFVDRICEVHA